MRVASLSSWDQIVQRTLWIICGWALVVTGLLLLPAPVPVPLIGVMPLLIGLAILTTHSKSVRRRLQFLRHRFDWLSRTVERFAHRAPAIVKHMIRRTNPLAHVRLARMRSHRRH